MPSARGWSWTCTCTCPVIRSDRRRISQLTQQSRDHYLFLHAAGSLCEVCVRAWLDRGADTSRGTPCEPLKSAFRWAEELVSTLRASAADRSRTWSGGREGSSEKRPFSCSSVPKVFATQPLNVCGWLEGADCFSFSDFWSFGASDPGRSVAVAWAALSGDLERLKDIFESDDRFPVWKRLICPMFSNTGLFAGTWSWPSCMPREGQAHHNLHTVLLWMEGQESTEAVDFAFGPMNEHLDVLQTLTLKGKAFHVFSFEKCNHQLQLIKSCYSGQENVVSELLKVGAPAETSPLSGRHSSSPAGVFLASARSTGGSCFRGGCGPEEGGYFEMSDIDQRVGT